MATLYDKKTGKAYNVPHAIDAKEWLKTGKYSETKPEKKAPQKQTEGN